MSECTAAVERWKPVVGYESEYHVSDQGRVRSVDRLIVTRLGCTRPHHGRILKQSTHRDGHQHVRFSVNGVCTNQPVHRLVLAAFAGPCPPGMEACHGPGGPADNWVVNLRWDTHSANMFDRRRDGTDPQVNLVRCPSEHLLTAPNLMNCQAKNGHRACWACGWARNLVRDARTRGVNLDFKSVADDCYAKIMAGDGPRTHAERDRCPYSHLLLAPNLIAAQARDGHRTCLACDRARGDRRRAKSRGETIDFQLAADEHYNRIMSSVREAS